MSSLPITLLVVCAAASTVRVARGAGVVYPADGDTRVSPSELANLCGIDKDGTVNAAAQEACAIDAAHYTFDSGVIRFARSDDGAGTSDAPDGELWYQLWGERDDHGPIPENNLILWFNGGPGTPPSLGLQTGIAPLFFGIPPHAAAQVQQRRAL